MLYTPKTLKPSHLPLAKCVQKPSHYPILITKINKHIYINAKVVTTMQLTTSQGYSNIYTISQVFREITSNCTGLG